MYSDLSPEHVILPSEFWISIYNDKNRPILNNYENARLPWNLQIYRFSKIDTNWIFLIPFKALHLYTLEIYIARKIILE